MVDGCLGPAAIPRPLRSEFHRRASSLFATQLSESRPHAAGPSLSKTGKVKNQGVEGAPPLTNRIEVSSKACPLKCPALRNVRNGDWLCVHSQGHERHFRDVRDESGLPWTPDRLRRRSEPTLRANCRHRSGHRFAQLRADFVAKVIWKRSPNRILSP